MIKTILRAARVSLFTAAALATLLATTPVAALDNGVAETPPMGVNPFNSLVRLYNQQLTFEDRTARRVRVVHALSEGTQNDGFPGSDLDFQPFGGEDGVQVTEINIAHVEDLPDAFEPGAGPAADVIHPPLEQ